MLRRHFLILSIALASFYNDAALANIDSVATCASVPTGTVLPFAGGTPPVGYILADGSSIDRVVYAALFAVIGTTYGAANANSFNLPDLRGRAAIGAGQGPGLSARALGDQPGSETHTLTMTEMPSHAHSGTTGVDSPDHSHGQYSGRWGGYGALNTGTELSVNPSSGWWYNGQTAGANVRHTHTIPSEGGNQPHSIMPPSLALQYIIKY